MRKIPTLFMRDPETHMVTQTLTRGCEWVLAGEGIATRKVDGTSLMLRNAKAYKCRVLNPNKNKTAPEGFELVETDTKTGKHVGWVPVDPKDPGDQFHVEAINNLPPNLRTPSDCSSTYELVGPKVQQNTEHLERHKLIRHSDPALRLDASAIGIPKDATAVEAFARLDRDLETSSQEGIVWHHPDGRMAKLKRRDFGHKWPQSPANEAAPAWPSAEPAGRPAVPSPKDRHEPTARPHPGEHSNDRAAGPARSPDANPTPRPKPQKSS